MAPNNNKSIFFDEINSIDFSNFEISSIMDTDMFDYIYSYSPQTIKDYIDALKTITQRKDYHPEGDVYIHTKTVVNRIAETKNIDLIIAAYLHDTGKDRTQKIKNSIIMHPGHEAYSSQLLNIGSPWRIWIKKLGGAPDTIKFIISNHMKMKYLSNQKNEIWYNSISSIQKKYLDIFSSVDKGGLYE